VTIAACYVSREGVVLGADSTTTFDAFEQNHYLNHAQKIFEIGEHSTFGVVTWGLGGLRNISYRTYTAHLSDDLNRNPATSVRDVADRWTNLLWPDYQTVFANEIRRAIALQTIAVTAGRSPQEEKEYASLAEWTTGFCLGGHCLADRIPDAYEIIFDVRQRGPKFTQIIPHIPAFWGAPSLIERLIYSMDWRLYEDIMRSGKWKGTAQDLLAMMGNYALATPWLPIREAIDFVHASIYTTIKSLKFSQNAQICGGPIEIAAITSDRYFRWVRHKRMDEAVREQELKV
jgi:hypothetical protein